jgi:two-component system, response regulator PdtaR
MIPLGAPTTMDGPKPPTGRYGLMARSHSKTPTTVLIVEDEAILRLELTGRLTEMGFTVLSADQADEAVIMLETHPEIRVLFTDIRMPGQMDGVRLANHARQRWPPLKIIVTSGLIDTDLMTLPDDSIFLSKPYPPEDLAGALAQLAQGGPHTIGARLQARV